MKVNAYTITDAQIREVRDAYIGYRPLTEDCDVALSTWRGRSSSDGPRIQHEARQICADAFNALHDPVNKLRDQFGPASKG